MRQRTTISSSNAVAGHGGGGLCILVLLPVLLVLLGTVASEQKCEPPPASALDRIDCHPDRGANEVECQRRGCCWLEQQPINETSHDEQLPSCFFPTNFNCYNIFRIYTSQVADSNERRRRDGNGDYDDDDDDDDKHLLGRLTNKQSKGNREIKPTKEQSWLIERRSDCPASGFHNDANRLKLELKIYGSSIINIKISEPDRPHRFEPKLPEINLPAGERSQTWRCINSIDYNKNDSSSSSSDANDDCLLFGGDHGKDRFLKVELDPLSGLLRVIHQAAGKILFEAQLQKLIYSRRFIQLPTKIGSSLVYGLGQQMGAELLKHPRSKTYTMFNYGHPPQSDGRTAYSSYPFYINIAPIPRKSVAGNESSFGEEPRRIDMMATGALMLNANAMDAVLRTAADDQDRQAEGSITWRLVGGIVNLFLFAGPKPHDVIGRYQSLVGRPMVPPAWALGYHQSRLNYRYLLPVKEAWARTRGAGIPMESLWTDVDFLLRSTSYTVSNPELGDLVSILQQQFGMHYMPIVDPTISLQEDPATYEALKLALSMDLFVRNPTTAKSNSTTSGDGDGESSPAIVTAWPEKSALLDFTHRDIVVYLKRILQEYRQKANFDGLWLDMNEPEVFGNHRQSENDANACPLDEELQYWPGGRNLNERTLCMAAELEAGKHFDLHNLYAFYQSKAHFEAIKSLNSSRRPFVISRAQFVGQGKYSGSWLGDFGSTFEHMHWSVLGTIQSNWFGQPMIGADICGFFGAASDELCARWFSLGAFYPLARHHNDGSSRDQDPGALNEDVQRSARVALLKRYSLLPFLYSLFHRNYLGGEPVVSSVLFAFADSFDFVSADHLASMSQYEDQLVWGRSLVIAPVLKAGENTRHVHLPAGVWYDVSIGLPGTDLSDEGPYDALKSNWPAMGETEQQKQLVDAEATEDNFLLRRLENLRKPINCERSFDGCLLRDHQTYSPIGSVNIFLRGGSILPTFRKVSHLNPIDDLWREPSFFLEVALDADASATGFLYWDSGESAPADEIYNQVFFWATGRRLTLTQVMDRYAESLRFDGFVVYGAKLDQQPADRVYKNVRLVYKYNAKRGVLTCTFKSTVSGQEDHDDQLVLKRYENLIIKW